MSITERIRELRSKHDMGLHEARKIAKGEYLKSKLADGVTIGTLADFLYELVDDLYPSEPKEPDV